MSSRNFFKFTKNLLALNIGGSKIVMRKEPSIKYAKTFLKHINSYTPQENLYFFECFFKFEFKLDNFAYRTLIITMQSQLSEFTLNDYITVKNILSILRERIGHDSKDGYVGRFEKELTAHLESKLMVVKPRQVIPILSLFPEELTQVSFEKLLAILSQNFSSIRINLNSITNIVTALAVRKHVDLNLIEKISDLILRPNDELKLDLTKMYNIKGELVDQIASKCLDRLNSSYLKLNHYDPRIYNFIANKNMDILQSRIGFSKMINENMEIIETMLKAFVHFKHKRSDLVEFIRSLRYGKLNITKHQKFPENLFSTYVDIVEKP